MVSTSTIYISHINTAYTEGYLVFGDGYTAPYYAFDPLYNEGSGDVLGISGQSILLVIEHLVF